MNKEILKATGFSKQVENIEKGVCAWCGSDKTKRDHFRDALSWKEFQISHLCQICQDSMFE